LLGWHTLIVGRLILPADSEQMRKGLFPRERRRLIANSEDQGFTIVFAGQHAPGIVGGHMSPPSCVRGGTTGLTVGAAGETTHSKSTSFRALRRSAAFGAACPEYLQHVLRHKPRIRPVIEPVVHLPTISN